MVNSTFLTDKKKKKKNRLLKSKQQRQKKNISIPEDIWVANPTFK